MPTEDEKKKKPAGFDLNASPEGFANLGGAPSMAGQPSPANAMRSSGESAMADAAAVANDPEMRAAFMEQQRTATELNKEALRSRKFENENAGRDPKRERLTPLRTIEARERSAQQREANTVAETQRREDFWSQGKANERPEVREAREGRAADFNQRQDAQRQRMDDRLKPIREAAFARQDAEKQRQTDMKDPAKRMADLRMRAARDGVKLNYAEVSGPDGKKATYMAPTVEGSKAYMATRGNKNLQNMATAASGRAAGLMTPQMPQRPATGAPAGAMAATNAMAARTPAPKTPNPVTPTFNPAQPKPAAQPSVMAGAPAQADPNAAAAIASFNQSVAQQPRGSSMAQNANLRNLQRGDIPTLANVPGEVARRATSAVGNFIQEGMQQSPNRVRDLIGGVGEVASGQKPLISTRRPEKITPSRSPAPRMTAQAAEQKKKNPILVN